MPKLTCKEKIQRILGIINTILKLSPSLAAHITNQKTLLCKGAIWHRAYDQDQNYMKNTLKYSIYFAIL